MNFLGPGDPVRVKICGITSAADAEMAIAAGADALGFNFYSGSKRRILFEESRDWISALEGRAFRVAVVVNSGMSELEALRDSRCFEAVQFHGDETPELCAHAGFPVWIRAVRVRERQSLQQARRMVGERLRRHRHGAGLGSCARVRRRAAGQASDSGRWTRAG